jgi:hypothetical protein
LYKLYNELLITTSSYSGIELTRGFLQFDLSPLRELTGSLLNYSTSSFKCYLSLTDAYSGQTTPSNYTLVLNPLAKPFSEGRGFDVVEYRDLDAVNWVTASVMTGSVLAWTITGSMATGSIGDSNIDYYVSGVISGGNSSLTISQSFELGNENLLMDVTHFVSATLAGILPDYGFRLAFLPAEETDTTTRFVKRFYSRHSNNHFKRPKLIVQYADKVVDTQLASFFDRSGSINVYNTPFGSYQNFVSSSNAVTGANCLKLFLYASHSITFWTSSYSTTHSQSINHLTTSYHSISRSFSGSQFSVNGKYQTGIYSAPVFINSFDSDMSSFISGATSVTFIPVWKSIDGSVTYATGSDVVFTRTIQNNSNVAERNFVVAVPNLKYTYTNTEVARLRVFVQDYNTDVKAYYVPIDATSKVFQRGFWRLVHKHTKEIVIPFETTNESTALSYDGSGMYFDIYMADLPTDQVYELEFLFTENGQDYLVQNQGFVFKVIK